MTGLTTLTAKFRAANAAGAVLLGVVLCAPVACQDEPVVSPEQRMRVVSLADADRTALEAPQFAPFREALLRVRLKEAQRPTAEDTGAAAVAAYNTDLEMLTIQVITIMQPDDWSWDDRQLMNRALRGATVEDLRQIGAPAG